MKPPFSIGSRSISFRRSKFRLENRVVSITVQPYATCLSGEEQLKWDILLLNQGSTLQHRQLLHHASTPVVGAFAEQPGVKAKSRDRG